MDRRSLERRFTKFLPPHISFFSFLPFGPATLLQKSELTQVSHHTLLSCSSMPCLYTPQSAHREPLLSPVDGGAAHNPVFYSYLRSTLSRMFCMLTSFVSPNYRYIHRYRPHPVPTLVGKMSHMKRGSIPSMETTGDALKDETVIVVLGASGDLAKKKTFPALFALFQQGLLPKDVHIIGYARTSRSLATLAHIADMLQR